MISPSTRRGQVDQSTTRRQRHSESSFHHGIVVVARAAPRSAPVAMSITAFAAPSPADRPAAPLTHPLATLRHNSLAFAGGKAANLGELVRAGLPVPPGFCVTTHAYALAVASIVLDRLLDELTGVPPEDRSRQLAAYRAGGGDATVSHRARVDQSSP